MKTQTKTHNRRAGAPGIAGGLIWVALSAIGAALLFSSCVTGYPLRGAAPSCATNVVRGRTVTLLTWNLGYGGEGASTSLSYDGGKHLLPAKRSGVLANTAGIVETLHHTPADIYLLQEVARPSTINHGVNLLGRITDALPCYAHSFSPKISEGFLGIHVDIGEATISHFIPAAERRYNLPRIPGPHLLKQRYFLLVTRYPIAGSSHELVVANLHLAVIDKGARTRMAQLRAMERFMRAEYRKGNYVLLGGDWNLQFTKTHFPMTTNPRYLRWVHAMPSWFPPPGWHRGYARGVPTVRSLDQPYRKGHNFTTIGDGFVYSPNIALKGIHVIRDGFAYSDHQPVVATIALRP